MRSTRTLGRNTGGRAPVGRGMMLCATLRPQETLGSWFRATARLHGCSRWVLAKALVAARNRDFPPGEIDWDVHPPVCLLDTLAPRLPRRFLTELRRRIPAPHRDLLRPLDRGVLCTRCMEEGAQDPLWDRCEDLWSWTVVCAKHQCPLVGISWLGKEPRPHVILERDGRSVPDRLSVPLSAESVQWLMEVQQLFRPGGLGHRQIQYRFRDHSAFDESLARLIIRDLVMATACDIEGTTMLEWTLPRWRRWVWRSEDRLPLTNPPIWAPLGDLYLRQEAIRLAGQLWHCLHGDFRFDRSDDERAYVVIRQMNASSGYGRFFGELLSHWPRLFRAKWTQAFGTIWHRAERVSRSTHLYLPRPVTRDARHALKLLQPRARKAHVRPCTAGHLGNTRSTHEPQSRASSGRRTCHHQ
jgi:hypothetical protein